MAKLHFINTHSGRCVLLELNPENNNPYIPSHLLEIGLKHEFDPYVISSSSVDIFRRSMTKPIEPLYLSDCMSCSCKIFDNQKRYIYAGGRVVKTIAGNKLICSNCSSNFVSCEFCCNFYHADDLFYNVCKSCIAQVPRNIIRNYTHKVENDFDIKGKSIDDIYYGVELELESENYGEDILVVNDLTKGFSCLKRDSSIEQGFEIVSAPCSINEHYKLWDNFFEKLPPTVKPMRTCGMHVHVSRIRMSSLQIGKMLVFLHGAENRNFIRLIAGRPSNFHNDFETPKKITDGKNGGMLPQNSDRHTALNLNSNKTIEFRIFKATKNKTEFFSNIEFCKALVKFTDWGNFSVKDAANYKIFMNYVLENAKEYPNLRKNFQKKSFSLLTSEKK